MVKSPLPFRRLSTASQQVAIQAGCWAISVLWSSRILQIPVTWLFFSASLPSGFIVHRMILDIIIPCYHYVLC